jgi:hypothetical protein
MQEDDGALFYRLRLWERPCAIQSGGPVVPARLHVEIESISFRGGVILAVPICGRDIPWGKHDDLYWRRSRCRSRRLSGRTLTSVREIPDAFMTEIAQQLLTSSRPPRATADGRDQVATLAQAGSQTIQGEGLQGSTISLARIRCPHEARGDHAAERCLCDQVNAHRRSCREVGPDIFQQLAKVDEPDRGELTVIHHDPKASSALKAVRLLENAAPPVACRRGVLEVTSLSQYYKHNPMLRCDGMLRCSLARAADNIYSGIGRHSPSPHEARLVEHVFGNAIICKSPCV